MIMHQNAYPRIKVNLKNLNLYFKLILLQRIILTNIAGAQCNRGKKCALEMQDNIYENE